MVRSNAEHRTTSKIGIAVCMLAALSTLAGATEAEANPSEDRPCSGEEYR